jgi:hypothetical protein
MYNVLLKRMKFVPVLVKSLKSETGYSNSTELSSSTTTYQPPSSTLESVVRCPDNIMIQLLGERTTSVRWFTPSGDRVEVDVPAGEYHYKQTLPDGTNCSFSIVIRGE